MGLIKLVVVVLVERVKRVGETLIGYKSRCDQLSITLKAIEERKRRDRKRDVDEIRMELELVPNLELK